MGLPTPPNSARANIGPAGNYLNQDAAVLVIGSERTGITKKKKEETMKPNPNTVHLCTRKSKELRGTVSDFFLRDKNKENLRLLCRLGLD